MSNSQKAIVVLRDGLILYGRFVSVCGTTFFIDEARDVWDLGRPLAVILL